MSECTMHVTVCDVDPTGALLLVMHDKLIIIETLIGFCFLLPMGQLNLSKQEASHKLPETLRLAIYGGMYSSLQFHPLPGTLCLLPTPIQHL